jgi:hypothetical protein
MAARGNFFSVIVSYRKAIELTMVLKDLSLKVCVILVMQVFIYLCI